MLCMMKRLKRWRMCIPFFLPPTSHYFTHSRSKSAQNPFEPHSSLFTFFEGWSHGEIGREPHRHCKSPVSNSRLIHFFIVQLFQARIWSLVRSGAKTKLRFIRGFLGLSDSLLSSLPGLCSLQKQATLVTNWASFYGHEAIAITE